MSKPKASFLAAFLLLFGLSACSPSWIADPIARFIKNKTGIEIKWQEISLGINPLRLESKGIQVHFKQSPVSWEVAIKDLRAVFGWTMSWENLPWPVFYVEKISINRPRLSVQLPEPGKEGDWMAGLKKCPALKQIEVQDLSGRMTLGENVFQIASGTRVSASFSPDQGGKIEFQIKGLQGRLASKGIKIQAGAQGAVALSDLQDRPKWQGLITLSHGRLISEKGKASELSGIFNFLYQPPLIKISTSSARAREVQWNKDDLSLQGRGTMIFSGSIQDKSGGKKEGPSLEGKIKFDSLDFDLRKGNRAVKGKAEGQVRISGVVSHPFIKGNLRSIQTDLDLSQVHTRGMETEILFEGAPPNLFFPTVQARADQTSLQLSASPLLVTNPEIRLSIRLAEGGRQIRIKDIGLKTDNWGNLSGSLFFEPSKGPVPSGKVQVEGFPLIGFLTHFFPEVASSFPNEITCQGTAEWTRDTAGSPFIFNLSTIPASFSLHLPGSDWRGEKLKTRLEAQGKWFPESRKVQVVLNQRLSGGSVSRPPWIFSFDDKTLSARMEGIFQGESQTGLFIGTLGFTYDPLGEVLVSGEGRLGSDSQSYSGSIEVKDLPLGKGFPLLAGGPLSDRYPFLKPLSPRGLLNVALSISKNNEAYDLKGRLTGSGIDLTSQDPSFFLKNIGLDIPFRLSSPGIDPGKILFSESGSFQVEKFQGPQIALNNLGFPVLAKTNQFEVPDKVEVPLWGGSLSLSSFKLMDPLGDMKMETAISLKDLDLNQMAEGLKISGTVSGDLEPVRIDKEKAHIGGILKARVFEGQVEGKNWVILRPFSRERVIQGDLFFNHLNLETLTERFSFGKITGYLQGQMTGLALRVNRLEQFNLFIKTEEVAGVPKKINVKAIENISLLGTGWESLDVLRQGFNRFITEYEYRDIGLACALKDDRFSLHGTIVEDGVEYLVRSPGWFGIDIVNKNPDNEINFSDIIDRIQRIGRKPQEGGSNEKK